MLQWLKRLMCKHDDKTFIRNVYGDEILELGNKRSIHRCKLCGKIVFSGQLHITEDK